VNTGCIYTSRAPECHKLVNNKSTKSEKQWFIIITNQFQKLALAQEFQRPSFRTSKIRDFASNLTDYRCLDHIIRKEDEKGKLLSTHHHQNGGNCTRMSSAIQSC
jgi:hypothetical protein